MLKRLACLNIQTQIQCQHSLDFFHEFLFRKLNSFKGVLASKINDSAEPWIENLIDLLASMCQK